MKWQHILIFFLRKFTQPGNLQQDMAFTYYFSEQISLHLCVISRLRRVKQKQNK